LTNLFKKMKGNIRHHKLILYSFLIFSAFFYYHPAGGHGLSLKSNDRVIYFNPFIKYFPSDTSKSKKNKIRCDISSELYQEGLYDAWKNHNANGSFSLCFFTTTLFPPVGFITTVAVSFSPVKDKNITSSYPLLINNPDFRCGYLKGAKKVKLKKSWIGFGSGLFFFSTIIWVISTYMD
jgi:hypothetical protein